MARVDGAEKDLLFSRSTIEVLTIAGTRLKRAGVPRPRRKVELEDQVTGVNYLKTLPYVDGSRIGIWGWSYGGFMTLEALFDAAEVFKTGVAVAPVSDWPAPVRH